MIKPIRTEPEVEQELLEAARWYEQRRPGLGLEFLAAIGAAVELIQRDPAAESPSAALGGGSPAIAFLADRSTVGEPRREVEPAYLPIGRRSIVKA